VYVLAQIPAPNPGASVPSREQATDFKVELSSIRSITLKWKAKHTEGSDRVVYFVQRKLVSEVAAVWWGVGQRRGDEGMIPKVIYTADLSESPDKERLTAWKRA